MRKIYALGFFLFFVTVQAQTITFTDPNFKAALLAATQFNGIATNSTTSAFKIDSNNDGEIQQSEALNVWGLNISNRGITNLTGLQFFTNIRQLNLSLNPIAGFNFPQLMNLNNITISGQGFQSFPDPDLVLPTTLTSIGFEGFDFSQQLPNLSAFPALTGLTYNNCNLTSFPAANFPNITSLSLLNNNVTTLDLSAMTALRFLYIDSNVLTLLVVPLALEQLTLNNTSINTINLPSSLRVLDFKDNPNLTAVNLSSASNISSVTVRNSTLLTNLNLPPTGSILSYLALVNLGVTSVVTNGYPTLNYLAVVNCPLTTPLDLTNNTQLSQFWYHGNNLTNFYFNSNNIQNFPELDLFSIRDIPINGPLFFDFTGLNQLGAVEFNNCGLTAVDLRRTSTNNSGSIWLNLLNNPQLTSFDLTNFQLVNRLGLSGCPISSLNLNNSQTLNQLYIDGNLLNQIDLSSTGVTILSTSNAPNLTTINLKNSFTSVYGNLSMQNCPNLQSICGDDNEINAIQSTINFYGYTNCFTNTYCSFNIGGTAYQINGNILLDLNNNGCSPTDVPAGNVRVNVTRSGVTVTEFTNSAGGYALAVNAGSYTITPVLEHPTYFTLSPATAIVNFPTNTSPSTRNFCLTASGVRPDLEVALFPLNAAVPGFVARYLLVYKNKGNTIQSGSVSLNFPNTLATLTNATPAAASQSGGNMTWNFSNLQPFESRTVLLQFTLNTPMANPPLNGGDVLPYAMTVSGATDQTPADNSFTLNQPVVNSFDPNDKTCLQGSVVGTSVIGQYVHYLIRFENTGTFPATNVIITDVIDTNKFDINTLIPLQASHAFRTRVVQNNRVEFVFQGINLPFDDANNDGYVAFKIKTKNTLVVGDTFDNTANIFFDYNYPIITNTASTLIQNLGVTTSELATFALAQNPVGSQLTFTGLSAPLQSVSIYNTHGQLVQSAIHPSEAGINVQGLAPGVYFVQGVNTYGTSVVKMVKE